MSLLNVGARALLVNQVALQTTGHNISNVNTPGYSRQSVVMQTVQGQFTGGGYIGQGVNLETIVRNYSELLTRQATASAAVQSGDSARVERLRQLQDVFSGGESGIGAAINDMMNALADVVSAPTDLTARSVALTRMDETALRMRDASQRLDEISYTVAEQLRGNVTSINYLAQNIAGLNDEIARATGSGHTPNDLLDQRDQLIRELNKHIQTSQVSMSDGTVSLFVAGSQPLVMSNRASTISIDYPTEFGAGSGQKSLYVTQPGSNTPVELNQSMLSGGEVTGLLRFQNSDLAEGRYLLGRMALAISETMNAQNRLGLTLDGQPGGNLFMPINMGNAIPGASNPSAAIMGLAVADPTKLQASSYEIAFTGADTGSVMRHSDNKVFTFSSMAELETIMLNDGLLINDGSGNPFPGAATNDRFMLNPLLGAAAQMKSLQYAPNDLAAANPVNAAMGTTNTGSLQLVSLKATGQPNPPGLVLPPPTGVVLTFDAGPPSTYAVTDSNTPPSGTSGLAYAPGQAIVIDGWEITLSGAPGDNDTITVGNATDPQYGDWYKRDAGNANALMGLRDVSMFNGATLSDGFASAMAQVGTRTQSAQFAAQMSASIAANLERDRSAVSGVNLDEEAARLLQFQQAYQASAKVIQIAQSVFDSLMQSVGR